MVCGVAEGCVGDGGRAKESLDEVTARLRRFWVVRAWGHRRGVLNGLEAGRRPGTVPDESEDRGSQPGASRTTAQGEA